MAYSNGSWDADWESLSGGLASGPDAASWGEGHLDVFIRGNDNQLWHRWYVTSLGWSGWEPLGNPSGGGITADPGATCPAANKVDVFVRAADNGLWHRWFDGQQWSSTWEPMGGTCTSGPDATSWTR
jgi:hypothetical protein